MRARPAALLALAALALAPAAARGQTTSFTGRYALKITFGPTCRASVASVTVPLSFTQASGATGLEIDGRPVEPGEGKVAQALLLYAAAKVHGPFSSLGSRTSREPITTSGGLLLLPWLMLDGTVTSVSGRAQASGTAFGFASVGQASEDTPSSLASCTASDFSWSLDPQ